MENLETDNPPVETPSEAVKRVARCLDCSNEWIASNGAESKPSRCPACMSRDVKWRDECTGDEISKKEMKSTVKRRTTKKRTTPKRNPNGSFAKATPEPDETKTQAPAAEPEPIPPRPPAPAPMQAVTPQPQAYEEEDEEDEEEEFTYQDAVNAMPKIPMQTVVILLGAAAAVGVFFFLWGKVKNARPVRVEQHQEQTPEQTYSQPIIYSFGGNLA